MIFADKLIALRKKNGWSQEELAEKLDVSRQTISKWEGAQSVPDLGRMLKLSHLLGVTTDYLMKDELELMECSAESLEPDGAVAISMEQAAEFLRLRDLMGSRVALGVLLGILCPVPLILLSGAQEVGRFRVSEDFAAGLGSIFLFLLVAAAVGLFIQTDIRMKRYEDWEKLPLETAYGVDGLVRDRQEKYTPCHTRLMIAGVLLCVLCPTPLMAGVTMGGADWIMILATAFLLVLVALGVLCMVRTCIIWDSFQILLETGDYTQDRKREHRRNSAVAVIYWGSVTAVYLGYSFVTEQWDRSWILWPVAGVCYGVLAAILRVIRKDT